MFKSQNAPVPFPIVVVNHSIQKRQHASQHSERTMVLVCFSFPMAEQLKGNWRTVGFKYGGPMCKVTSALTRIASDSLQFRVLFNSVSVELVSFV